MSYWDKFKARESVGKYAWAIIFAVLKEAGNVALAEFAAALEQYKKERKTPDGWTEEEYLTYAIGRLQIIKAQDIGPFVIDEVLDWGIERIIDVLEGKLDKLDDDEPVEDEEPPVEPPPVVPPPTKPTDPYYPAKYGPNDDLPYSRFAAGDQVWKEGLVRFVIPRLFTELPIYRQATNGATLIEVIT